MKRIEPDDFARNAFMELQALFDPRNWILTTNACAEILGTRVPTFLERLKAGTLTRAQPLRARRLEWLAGLGHHWALYPFPCLLLPWRNDLAPAEQTGPLPPPDPVDRVSVFSSPCGMVTKLRFKQSYTYMTLVPIGPLRLRTQVGLDLEPSQTELVFGPDGHPAPRAGSELYIYTRINTTKVRDRA